MIDEGLIVIRVESCGYVKGKASQAWKVDWYALEKECGVFSLSPQSAFQVSFTLIHEVRPFGSIAVLVEGFDVDIRKTPVPDQAKIVD